MNRQQRVLMLFAPLLISAVTVGSKTHGRGNAPTQRPRTAPNPHAPAAMLAWILHRAVGGHRSRR